MKKERKIAIGIDSENNASVELCGTLGHLSPSGGGHPAAVAIGIDGGDVGFALRSNPSHSGDKGDGGVNTNMVIESCAMQEDNQNGILLSQTVGSLRSDAPGSQPCGTLALVTHSLKAEGFDASEDGTGRGVPLVPEIVGALSDGAHMGGGRTVRTLTPAESLPCVSSKWSKGSGGPAGDECQNLVPVTGGFFNNDKPIAFSSKDHGADATDNLSPILRACGHDESHANAGAPPAIAFPARMSGTQRATSENVSSAIGAANPTGIATTMAVRRLTPRECERLQGFDDNWTLVQFNGKPACDGPRYKAIGNSMAVPNIEWIGRRMDLVDELVPWMESI